MMDSSNNGKKFMSEINVTPFVDVMLVLLIIFMVTAPLMIQGVDVNLPKTTASELRTDEEPLILTINKDLEISLEDHNIKFEELETKLETILKYRKEERILIKADEDVSYGYFIKVVAGIKRAGIESLGMITEPED